MPTNYLSALNLTAPPKPISAVWIWSEPILLALKQDPEVAHYAAIYLKWLLLGLPAYGFNNVARRYFQSQGLFDAPTRIIFFVSPINIFLNYLLGKLPFMLNPFLKRD